MISQRIDEILQNIDETCLEIGVDPKEVILVAVTKYTDVPLMQEAINAGIQNIGENRLQNAKEKFAILNQEGMFFKRHMVGHLQTNKVKDAVTLFDMIQSVDSIKVAFELNKYAAQQEKVMEVLVQVNSSRESQKSGVEPEKVLDLINEISTFEYIDVKGLMTIGLLTDDQENIARCFTSTKSLFDQAKEKFSNHPRVDMKYLSMGMSQDYQLAIRCGANMVRVGSAIFG